MTLMKPALTLITRHTARLLGPLAALYAADKPGSHPYALMQEPLSGEQRGPPGMKKSAVLCA